MTANGGTDASPTKGQVGRAIFKVCQFLLSFATTLIVVGFGVFAFQISRAAPPDPIPKADGIVVLTGTGGGRLSAGAELLKRGLGEHLLISGVNKSISAEEIQNLLKLDDAEFNCCVTLDYEAENTFQNGKETANWARALGYESILLVTSSYHMPRSKVEISTAMDGIRIIPYPVAIEHKADEPWWGGKEKLTGLLREYGKLLVTYAREPGIRPKPKSQNKRIFSIPGLIIFIFILVIAYIGLWMMLRSTVVSSITNSITEMENEGYRVEHGGLAIDGFPFAIDARSPNIVIRSTPNSAASANGNWSIETDEVDMYSTTLTPMSWSIGHRGELGVDMRPNGGSRYMFDISPANIDSDIAYSLSGNLKSLRAKMNRAQINQLLGAEPAVLGLAGLNASLDVEAGTAKSQQALGMAYTALGQNISRVSLKGDIENFPLLEMEGLDAWLQSPAKIKSEDWQLMWGKADIVGNFDIGFKNNLPEGVIRFRVKNVDALMQSLVAMNLIDRSFTGQLNTVINSLQADEDGRQSIEITIRDGVVKYGFFTLMRL